MRPGRNRLGRKDESRRERAIGGERPGPQARWAVPLLIGAAMALAAGPAHAGTGGATTLASSDAQAGRGLSFSPMRSAGATWYGPGLYGRQTACGQILRPQTIGVAHRRLPCGTPVEFEYQGRRLIARVIDRGPYTPGNAFDLTNGARQALGFEGAGQIHYAVALNYARK